MDVRLDINEISQVENEPLISFILNFSQENFQLLTSEKNYI